MRMLLLAGTSLLVLTVSVTAPAAHAAYTVTLQQVGDNVVATGGGTIDTAGLSFDGSGSGFIPYIGPDTGLLNTGPVGVEFTEDTYSGATGPTSFGSGSGGPASSGSGDEIGLDGSFADLSVPAGYVSDSPLTSTSTFDDQTFSSLGVTPGTYVYSFGSGANADTFTVQIGALAPVPEPASLALFGTGLLSLGMVVRRRHSSRA